MTLDDLPLGMRLKEQAGWNQTEADWRRIIALEPDGCFVAELEGRPVGTTCTCRFGPIGWIAMVLVEESARGRGVGTRLMQHGLASLDRGGVRTARLDATPLGRPLYEKLGFVAEYDLARWEGAAAGGQSSPAVVPAGDCPKFRPTKLGLSPFEAICELDRRATGTDRRRLLERLCQERPDALRVFAPGGEPAGYGGSRLGARAVQLGPIVAPDAAAGAALADHALAGLAGQAVFLDVPVDNRPASRWAESHGLRVQRMLTRMCRGEPVRDRPDRLWACFGPEKG
jgi:ribosomal protein S18 acetylase RimI-like enzyme